MRLVCRTLARLSRHLLPCVVLGLSAIAAGAAPVDTSNRTQTSASSDILANAPASVPATAPHAAIPFKQEKQSTDTLAYQSFAALVLAGLAAYGIVFGLKRFGGMTGGSLGKARRARTVDAIRLGRRSMLYVVEYQGQELLLAESEHGIQLLVSAPSATPAAPAHAGSQGVADA